MNDEMKAELAKILARDNEIRSAQNDKKQAHEAEMKAAEAIWADRVPNVLIPGLAPIVTMIEEAGWVCAVDKSPRGLKVTIYRGDMTVYQGRYRPFISFEMQKNWTGVSIHAAGPRMIGDDSTGSNVNVESDLLNRRVLDFFKTLTLQ